MKPFGYLTFLAATLGTLVQAVPTSAPKKTSYLTSTVFPNYIIPVKQAYPNTAFGTQYTGEVYFHSEGAKNETTLFVGFDMPYNEATKCQIRFNLPKSGGFPWVQTGNPYLSYYGLDREVKLTDTWNNRPARKPAERLGTILLRSLQFPDASESVVTGTIPCNKGQRLDFELAFRHGEKEGYLNWFEMITPKTGITIDMYFNEE